jgi:hypothetical protein
VFNRKQPSTIQHPILNEFYHYRLGVRFDPGALAEAFLPQFQLPLVSFAGRSRVAGEFRVTQPAQVWFTQQRGVNGVGGIAVGAFRGAPLLDPATFEGA